MSIELKELYYLNLVTIEKMIGMIVYFDAMDISFMKILFEKVIEDDKIFSDPEIQQMLIQSITTATTFRFWDKSKILNYCEYVYNDRYIKYNIENNILEFLEFSTIDGSIFYRREYKNELKLS